MNKFSLRFGLGTLMIFFLIWTACEKERWFFWNESINNFHPNVKFTHECSREEINFLDVAVKVNHGEFITNLYWKPTDGHQYLHFASCHPSDTKPWMRRISSKKSDLVPNVWKLKDWFKERGYPEDMINKETKGHLKVLHWVVLKHLKEVYQVIVELGYP